MSRLYNPLLPTGLPNKDSKAGACTSARIIQDVDKFLVSTKKIYEAFGVVVPGLGSRNGWRNEESTIAGVNRGNWGGARTKKEWPGSLWRHQDAEAAWERKIRVAEGETIEDSDDDVDAVDDEGDTAMGDIEAERVFPVVGEPDAEVFTGTRGGDADADGDILGFVFRDNTEPLKDSLFVFVGVDHEGWCLYRKINKSGISTGANEFTAFDPTAVDWDEGDRTIKDLFFGSDGGDVEYQFIGWGKKGVKEARKTLRTAVEPVVEGEGNDDVVDEMTSEMETLLEQDFDHDENAM